MHFNISDDSVSNHSCATNEWQCQSGDECIKTEYHCDGLADCTDVSDEVGCGKY